MCGRLELEDNFLESQLYFLFGYLLILPHIYDMSNFLDSWFNNCFNVGVIKLLLAPESNKMVAYRLLIRNVPVTTEGS